MVNLTYNAFIARRICYLADIPISDVSIDFKGQSEQVGHVFHQADVPVAAVSEERRGPTGYTGLVCRLADLLLADISNGRSALMRHTMCVFDLADIPFTHDINEGTGVVSVPPLIRHADWEHEYSLLQCDPACFLALYAIMIWAASQL